jgi:cysteine-rich repeat protein
MFERRKRLMRRSQRLGMPTVLATLVAIVAGVVAAAHAPAAEPSISVAGLFSVDAAARARARSGDTVDVTVAVDALKVLARQPESAFLLDVPLADGATESFALTRFDVFAADAVVIETDGQRERAAAHPAIAAFHGTGLDDPSLHVALAVADGEVAWALVQRDEKLITVIGPERASASTGRRHRMAGADAFDTTSARPGCDAAPIPASAASATTGASRSPHLAAPRAVNDTRYEVEVLVDVGNGLYAGPFGSDSLAATSYVGALFATVSSIYQRDLKIVPKLGQLVLWTSPEPFDGPDSDDQLTEYRKYNQDNRGAVARDLSHYLGYHPTYGGIAFLGGTCTTEYGYAVSNLDGNYTFPVTGFVWDVAVVAHEMGHNLGAFHTHCYSPAVDHCWNAEPGCYAGPVEPSVGEIMSYCHIFYSSVLAFRGVIGDDMRSYVELNNTCLSEKAASCGDGVVDPGEQCDDGNGNDGDCCSSSCVLLAAGAGSCDDGQFCTDDYECADSSCYHQPVVCDDANACTIDYCDDLTDACAYFDRPSSCDDGEFCTSLDSCQAGGVCAGLPFSCDDGDPCTDHACDEVGDTCIYTPLPPETGCRSAQTSVIGVRGGAKPKLTWKWLKGDATDESAYGNPDISSSADYALCTYDDSGQLLSSPLAPAGGLWRYLNGKGFKYVDKSTTGLDDGLSTLLLRTGGEGAAKIVAKGKKPSMTLPALPVAATGALRVQLRRADGIECWESLFLPPFKKNDGSRLKDKE